MKLVLDTDVVIAALRSSSGASAELLRLALRKECGLVISVPLLLEYEAVATRPEQLAAMRLDGQAMMRFLDGLANLAEHTETHFRYRPLTRDPADELVLEAAINGGADAIVTFNRRDFKDGPAAFGIACLLPKEVLEKLR